MQGHNGGNSVTAIWTNPPRSVKARAVRLTLHGDQLGNAETARRRHGTLSYTWSTFQQGTDVKVCVKFAGINHVACDWTKYVGNQG
ncbi:hypothetical protein ABT052_28830 [Streptomyces sp. NPDC002766]|uniref:hypothetical protein n=1 Tax=Streptomyces sp. NPDC002766 TaxID=3154429 RepID=UPI0033219769